MVPGMEMMACPNLSVSAEVMQHIVNVESGKNPFAIGVVGGQLMRQPQNLGEAIATAQMLESKGYNYSLGIAQVNRNNLGKYGLDSYEKAFSVCGNLEAGSRILAECYNSSGGDWGKAFSCYYSGNFTTGYRDGYVQKVFDSINRAAGIASVQPAAAIPLAGDNTVMPGAVVVTPTANQVTVVPTGAAYRRAIRSQVIDNAMNSVIAPAVASAFNGRTSPVTASQPDSNSIQQMMQQVAVANGQPVANGAPAAGNAIQQMMAQVQGAPSQVSAPSAAQAAPAQSDVFEPEVRGPNDAAPVQAAAQGASQAPSAQTTPSVDQADMRKGGSDDAFVF